MRFHLFNNKKKKQNYNFAGLLYVNASDNFYYNEKKKKKTKASTA